MKPNRHIAKLIFGALTMSQAFAAGSAEKAFQAGHVTVPSAKSFEQVTGALKSLVARNGMMVMAEVDQGKMLSMAGLSLKATLFLVGNPNVGKQLFEQSHGVGLYVPLRVFVFNDEHGKTNIAYDKPSTLLGHFDNEKIAMIGQMLDQKLGDLATMAAQ